MNWRPCRRRWAGTWSASHSPRTSAFCATRRPCARAYPHNTDICGTVEFFGTVLIVGMANGEFVSLSEQQVEDLWEMGALRRGDL